MPIRIESKEDIDWLSFFLDAIIFLVTGIELALTLKKLKM